MSIQKHYHYTKFKLLDKAKYIVIGTAIGVGIVYYNYAGLNSFFHDIKKEYGLEEKLNYASLKGIQNSITSKIKEKFNIKTEDHK